MGGIGRMSERKRTGRSPYDMTDEERSHEGYERYLNICRKLNNGAFFKKVRSAEFFNDQKVRFARRHEQTSVSPGRLKWLRDIDTRGLTPQKKGQT